MLKQIASLVACTLLLFNYQNTSSSDTQLKKEVKLNTSISVSKPKKVPISIEIPRLNVKAPVYPVGLDPQNRMDTISDAKLIGWYQYGSIPGEPGNSLFDGHKDWKGQMGTFFYLYMLHPNDIVTFYFSDSTKDTLKVISVNSYNANDVPDTVMNISGEERTTLITCDGEFNSDKGGYQDRCVVILHK